MSTETKPHFQYDETGAMVCNIPFRLNVWTPGNATSYSQGAFLLPERGVNPSLEFDFPAGTSTSDLVMAMEFEHEFVTRLLEIGYIINPNAAPPAKVDEVAQARQRVEQSAPPARPQAVDDLTPNRGPIAQQMSETPPSNDEMKVVIVAIERGESKLGLGYKLWRAGENGQRQSVGAVWVKDKTKALESIVPDNIAGMKVGMVMPVDPIVAYYVKGKPTGQGGFYNDFVRFEVAS
jgi:hypothetical protein